MQIPISLEIPVTCYEKAKCLKIHVKCFYGNLRKFQPDSLARSHVMVIQHSKAILWYTAKM